MANRTVVTRIGSAIAVVVAFGLSLFDRLSATLVLWLPDRLGAVRSHLEERSRSASKRTRAVLVLLRWAVICAGPVLLATARYLKLLVVSGLLITMGFTLARWIEQHRSMAPVAVGSSGASPGGGPAPRASDPVLAAPAGVPGPPPAVPVQSVITAAPDPATTGRPGVPFLAPLEQEVLNWLNRARTDPASVAGAIRDLKRHLRGQTLTVPGEPSWWVKEGAGVLDEAASVLDGTEPMGGLVPMEGLCLAARDHRDDTGPKGLVGHTGSGGAKLSDRLERHGRSRGMAGECVSYGARSGKWIVLQLLVDDDVPGRGHRQCLLDPRFDRVGIAFGKHSSLGSMCVIDVSEGFDE
ncbi:MAG: CAP domain-containing protein [Candidatus Riflebacteria bacterium]|nr:CAP domain-containing protein [Candidatus Riflebacteria bacterium]